MKVFDEKRNKIILYSARHHLIEKVKYCDDDDDDDDDEDEDDNDSENGMKFKI